MGFIELRRVLMIKPLKDRKASINGYICGRELAKYPDFQQTFYILVW